MSRHARRGASGMSAAICWTRELRNRALVGREGRRLWLAAAELPLLRLFVERLLLPVELKPRFHLAEHRFAFLSRVLDRLVLPFYRLIELALFCISRGKCVEKAALLPLGELACSQRKLK